MRSAISATSSDVSGIHRPTASSDVLGQLREDIVELVGIDGPTQHSEHDLDVGLGGDRVGALPLGHVTDELVDTEALAGLIDEHRHDEIARQKLGQVVALPLRQPLTQSLQGGPNRPPGTVGREARLPLDESDELVLGHDRSDTE